MIIAVDFDGTLCEDCYPGIGEANIRRILVMQFLQEMGGSAGLVELPCWGV